MQSQERFRPRMLPGFQMLNLLDAYVHGGVFDFILCDGAVSGAGAGHGSDVGCLLRAFCAFVIEFVDLRDALMVVFIRRWGITHQEGVESCYHMFLPVSTTTTTTIIVVVGCWTVVCWRSLKN